MTTAILAQIDNEISRLTQARNLLSTTVTLSPVKRGRPPNSSKSKKRRLSPEGRARISAAMKARWASKKTTSAKKGAQKSFAKAA